MKMPLLGVLKNEAVFTEKPNEYILDTQNPSFQNFLLQGKTRLRNKNRHILETCYNTYFERLVGGLRQLYGYDGFDAEDIAHRAFEKLAIKLSQVKIHNPEAFVWRVAQNFALREKRQQKVCKSYASDLAPVEVTHLTPERVLIGVEELDRVNAALASLSERRRQVFLLRRQDGLNYTEIAQALGISRPAVASHLAKAVSEIDRFLRES